MTWMTKIKDYQNIISLIVLIILNITFLIKDSIELKQCKTNFKSYRAELINELCNSGDGNYDFCVLKKAEYTFVEKNKVSVVIPDKKNEKIELKNDNVESGLTNINL